MSEEPCPRALLIDLDNCPRQVDHLPRSLAGFSRIIACYGGSEPKVSLGLVPLLAAAIQEGKLEIVGMKRPGKNAADFGLAFWAGRLAAEMPPETEFLILSQDGDLDHVVHLLKSTARKVRRVDGKIHVPDGAPPGVPAPPAESQGACAPDENDIQGFRTRYLLAGQPRPGKRAALINSIKAYFKGRKDLEPEEVLRGLLERGMVTIDEHDKVNYPQDPADIPF